MRRRSFLTSLTAGLAGLAGCAKSDGTGLGTNSSTDQSGATTRTRSKKHADEPNEFPDLGSVITAAPTPRTYALAPTHYRSDDGATVELAFTATATATHPARLRVTLENANDFSNTFRLRQTPPLGPDNNLLSAAVPDSSYRQSLVLAPTENHELAETVPEFRQNARGYWRLVGNADEWVPKTVRLDAGESVHAEYVLLGRHDGQGRPTATYSTRADEQRVRIAVWHTQKPGPTGSSRFAGFDAPPLPSENATQWFHAAAESTPSYLRPETERAELPASVGFTFVNHTTSALGCGGWNLYKLHEGEWFHIAPRVHLAVCRQLAPGGTDSWELNAFNGEAIDCADGRSVGHLGGGRYAVSVGYGHRTGLSAAVVDLVGPPVEVTPTDDVTSSREGATVTVTSPRWNDGERPPNARLIVEATDANAVGRLLPEQVMRRHNRGFRNTLPFFEEGVSKVVLRTDERTAVAVFEGGEPWSFAYRGSVYEATRE